MTFVLFLGSDISWVEEDILAALGSLGFSFGLWSFIAENGLAPALFLMLILEFGRFSSLLSSLLAGGVCALVVMTLNSNGTDDPTNLPYATTEVWLAALAAGFVAGLVYWIFSGHRSGRWLGQKSTTDV